MGNEGEEPADLAAAPAARAAARPRRKLLPILFLGGGALLAAYLTSKSPRDQHLSVVLGASADQVTQVEIQYMHVDGDLAQDVRMTFEPGRAPRVISHAPKLGDGDYRVRIDVDTTREGRRSVERRVTLGGGTTQVDLTTTLTAPQRPTPTAP